MQSQTTAARREGRSDQDVFATEVRGDDGRVLHPMLANTKADGSGDWYAVVVDHNGNLVDTGTTVNLLKELLTYQKRLF